MTESFKMHRPVHQGAQTWLMDIWGQMLPCRGVMGTGRMFSSPPPPSLCLLDASSPPPSVSCDHQKCLQTLPSVTCGGGGGASHPHREPPTQTNLQGTFEHLL